MTFNDFVVKECRQTWKELSRQGVTEDQRYRWYEDYETYCKENNITPEFKFH